GSATVSSGRDHPRVRGEHLSHAAELLNERGPSPRARGAHAQLKALGNGVGTIPACAGSTPRTRASVRPEGDHPRVRGEHVISENPDLFAGGPSPRARGAPAPAQTAEVAAGTIPACAGSTSVSLATASSGRDH